MRFSFLSREVSHILAKTMAKKSILLSYSGRNKVAKIPREDRNNISFLREEFKTLYSAKSVETQAIQFHRYDEDWQEYIELEDDDIVRDKEKLNVKIVPMLAPFMSTEKVSVIFNTFSKTVPTCFISFLLC